MTWLVVFVSSSFYYGPDRSSSLFWGGKGTLNYLLRFFWESGLFFSPPLTLSPFTPFLHSFSCPVRIFFAFGWYAPFLWLCNLKSGILREGIRVHLEGCGYFPSEHFLLLSPRPPSSFSRHQHHNYPHLSGLSPVCQKCQMSAFPMRARRWRGWTRGSRTPLGLRSAGRSSAHLTGRRCVVIWPRRCGRACGNFARSTISTLSTRDRLRRAIMSGRWTTARRTFTADRTGDTKPGSGMRPRTGRTAEPRGPRRRLDSRRGTAPGRDDREI